jgi:hypothetical protein
LYLSKKRSTPLSTQKVYIGTQPKPKHKTPHKNPKTTPRKYPQKPNNNPNEGLYYTTKGKYIHDKPNTNTQPIPNAIIAKAPILN